MGIRGSGLGIRNSVAIACVVLLLVAPIAAQAPPAPTAPVAPVVTDYVVGPQDVLTITSYDQNDLSGRFSVEADGTFTYPLIGRVKAGGLTLRQVEAQVNCLKLQKRIVFGRANFDLLRLRVLCRI